MKRLIAFAAVLCVAVSIQAETVQEKIDKAGGLVRIKGKGNLTVIDCRPSDAKAELKDAIEALQSEVYIDVAQTREAAFSLSSASQAVKASGASVAVFIVDDASLPMTLTASEEKWSLVNVAKIRSDSPSSEKFKKRLSTLFMRQCARVLGSDVINTPECCTYQVFDLKDLDTINTFALPWGASISLKMSVTRLGIEPVEEATYEDACEMGVAAQPTNEIQRAIWQKINNKQTDKADPTARWKRDFEKK